MAIKKKIAAKKAKQVTENKPTPEVKKTPKEAPITTPDKKEKEASNIPAIKGILIKKKNKKAEKKKPAAPAEKKPAGKEKKPAAPEKKKITPKEKTPAIKKEKKAATKTEELPAANTAADETPRSTIPPPEVSDIPAESLEEKYNKKQGTAAKETVKSDEEPPEMPAEPEQEEKQSEAIPEPTPATDQSKKSEVEEKPAATKAPAKPKLMISKDNADGLDELAAKLPNAPQQTAGVKEVPATDVELNEVLTYGRSIIHNLKEHWHWRIKGHGEYAEFKGVLANASKLYQYEAHHVSGQGAFFYVISPNHKIRFPENEHEFLDIR